MVLPGASLSPANREGAGRGFVSAPSKRASGSIHQMTRVHGRASGPRMLVGPVFHLQLLSFAVSHQHGVSLNSTSTNGTTALSSPGPLIGWNRLGFYRAGVGRPRLAGEVAALDLGLLYPRFPLLLGRGRTSGDGERTGERKREKDREG